MGLRNYLRKVCRRRTYFKSVCLLPLLFKEDKGGGVMNDLISRDALLKQLLKAKDDEIIKSVIGLVQTQQIVHIEDLEEQSLLLRLPCRVGDVVWRIIISDNYIMPCNVEEFVYSNSLYIIVREELFNTRRGLNINEIGKTVFLTQAEAERKLKEMESGNNGTME